MYTTTTSTFPSDLGISTRVGLTRGVGRIGAVSSFPEEQARYCEERLMAERDRRAARRSRTRTRRPVEAGVPRQRTSTEGTSHWLPRWALRSGHAA